MFYGLCCIFVVGVVVVAVQDLLMRSIHYRTYLSVLYSHLQRAAILSITCRHLCGVFINRLPIFTLLLICWSYKLSAWSTIFVASHQQVVSEDESLSHFAVDDSRTPATAIFRLIAAWHAVSSTSGAIWYASGAAWCSNMSYFVASSRALVCYGVACYYARISTIWSDARVVWCML